MTRTITIVCRGGNDFAVHEGEQFADRLCWDEMLGQIACMTHPQIGKPRYPLVTPEYMQAREDHYREMRARTDAERRE